MTNEKKLELIAETFDLDMDAFTPESSLDELGVLDSMSALSLIVMMDDECGKTLTKNEIKQFKTIKDIMDYMD